MSERSRGSDTSKKERMTNLEKPIGELLPGWQNLVKAPESATMVEIARRMRNDLSQLHLSQIPLEDSDGNIRSIVTGNGLAQWVVDGCPKAIAYDYREGVCPFPKETPLEEIMKTVEDFGYVLVKKEDGIGILSYTDVIGELAQR